MGKRDLKLLDCTLRDGGYINDWKWGFQCAKEIIYDLVKAGVDVIEVGFLRNINEYDPDTTVCNYIQELNKLLPEKGVKTMFSAMAMRSNYDVSKLCPYNGKGIEMIRITAHEYDLTDGMKFAYEVKEKGYKLSINPINIMGYSDENILWILRQVNAIHPYQFSIVDTFGSMKRRDLDRIVSLVDNNLDTDIRVALHLHENMSLSCSLAQTFIDKHLNRPISIDGSLMGMGRTPGNLPIELIADYLNDCLGSNYDIDYLIDAAQDYIAPIKGSTAWGYTPAYFLSARFNLHRNYAEYFLEKGDLTNRDINHILARFDPEKKNVFDSVYADKLYEEYKDNQIDDSLDRNMLKNKMQGNKILILAPGKTIVTHEIEIKEFIKQNNPIIISLNFIPETYPVDYAFFSNNKRYHQIEKVLCELITTSNLSIKNEGYHIDYNSVSGAFDQGCNSFIMILKLLKELNVAAIYAAGADGYIENEENYYLPSIRSYSKHDNKFNLAVSEAIHTLGIEILFVTPSAYQVEE